MIAKSNSFRNSANEKMSELKAADEQIDATLLEVKNCARIVSP